MLWTGSRLALVHIGDSRAYLLRDGELFQITHDHTIVQSMLDEGSISPDEAATHPSRSLLLRALDGGGESAPDIRLHDVEAGDRYLLCSDGLSTVVPPAEVQRLMSTVDDPEQAVRELVAAANRSGGPDNVSCVVADVRDPHPVEDAHPQG
jgi:protein phosphatase